MFSSKEASDTWREHMGVWRATELALDYSKSALSPMFDSYSYKIEPQVRFFLDLFHYFVVKNSSNGEAYIWEFHNTKMLVDSELPIFGGGNYPALTIRLRFVPL